MSDEIYFHAFVNNTPPALSMHAAVEAKMKENLNLAREPFLNG